MKILRAFIAFDVSVLLDVQAKPGMNRDVKDLRAQPS